MNNHGRNPKDIRNLPRNVQMARNEANWNTIAQRQKTARNNELQKMMGRGVEPIAGRALPTRDISAGAQKVLGYATHFMAAHQEDIHNGEDTVTKPLNKRVVNRLVRGTETMDYARSKLTEGRGNVDGSDHNFPQATARTRLTYKHVMTHREEQKKAGIVEMIRAGNCDHHSLVAVTHAGANLPDTREYVAKVRVPGHTFAELRGKAGKKKALDTDVIVDSWSSSDHAVLRKDSKFGVDMNPKKSTDRKTAFTHYTVGKAQGAQNWTEKEAFVTQKQSENFHTNMDAEAAATQKTAKRYKSWLPTSIASDDGATDMAYRKDTFDRQSGLTRNLQTVFTARQMGASIKGAAQHATFTGDKKAPKNRSGLADSLALIHDARKMGASLSSAVYHMEQDSDKEVAREAKAHNTPQNLKRDLAHIYASRRFMNKQQ